MGGGLHNVARNRQTLDPLDDYTFHVRREEQKSRLLRARLTAGADCFWTRNEGKDMRL